MVIPYTPHKLARLAHKYKLTPDQVEELYIRTLDDYELLDRACKYLSNGKQGLMWLEEL